MAWTAAIYQNDLAANSLVYAPASRLSYQIAGLMADRQNPSEYLSVYLFEKNDGSNPHDWSRVVYRKSSVDGRTTGWMHVEAGYGQYCQFESSFGENAWELERPTCAYFRACFSF